MRTLENLIMVIENFIKVVFGLLFLIPLLVVSLVIKRFKLFCKRCIRRGENEIARVHSSEAGQSD